VGAFVWFLVAGLRVLFNNYRYGEPALRNVNTLLLATFMMQTLMFFVVVGGLHGDMTRFCAWLGLSVSLNGGVARPVRVPVPKVDRKAKNFAGFLPRPRPAFEP
jgi:hypothetical protein